MRLDVPAGPGRGARAVSRRPREAVTLRNVPSFLHARDQVAASTASARCAYDMAFGGNFYAIVDAAAVGLEVDPGARRRADRRARASARRSAEPVHPARRAHRRLPPRRLPRAGPRRRGRARATAIHPGWLDRSPCGTGTSARMAALHARGELGAGRGLRQRVDHRHALHRAARRGGRGRRPPAVVPEITGRAWITGMGQYLLDERDPFPAGFAL